MNKARWVAASLVVWMIWSSFDTRAAEQDPNELHVLCSNASRPAISEMVPLFEKTFKARVQVHYANNPILKQQIEGGAEFDVVIIEPKMLQELAGAGFVSEGSVVALATVPKT